MSTDPGRLVVPAITISPSSTFDARDHAIHRGTDQRTPELFLAGPAHGLGFAQLVLAHVPARPLAFSRVVRASARSVGVEKPRVPSLLERSASRCALTSSDLACAIAAWSLAIRAMRRIEPGFGIGRVELHQRVSLQDDIPLLDVDRDHPADELRGDLGLFDRFDLAGRRDRLDDRTASTCGSARTLRAGSRISRQSRSSRPGSRARLAASRASISRPSLIVVTAMRIIVALDFLGKPFPQRQLDR